ncbi:myb/SANT-like DNA-binding domain-containing protein 7 isoform X2 [Rhineura floridana]|nr:myb/SANT-like DNA-binding domain-containing protein 7 isoform X2 [Rhineura floridana]XP_061475309.1 myb/SANT-like DNA-binding domain-containing protein 7 isoform X2 [Rhineura floridana]
MTGKSSAGTSSRKGRGVSWRLQETLDLLDIWGEQKIQDQLRSSHQNIDFFEYIAQKMTTRRHRRTALECRSKTKVMRLEYKRVIDHNSRAGNSKVTCPFYEQLHRILQGNASMKPGRVGRTLSFHLVPQLEAAREHTKPGLEELIPHDVHVVSVGEHLKQEDIDDTGGGMVTSNDTEEEMAEAGDHDITQMKEEKGSEGSGRDLDHQRPQIHQISPVRQDPLNSVQQAPRINMVPNPAAAPLDAVAKPPAAPSPTPDFAILRPKKRKGAETLFQELLQQSREEQEELLLEMGRDREVALNLLKVLKEDATECREERKQLMETLRAHNEILKGLVINLNNFTDAFASHPQARPSRPSVSNNTGAQRSYSRPNDENCSPRSPLRRLHSNNLSSSLFSTNTLHHTA